MNICAAWHKAVDDTMQVYAADPVRLEHIVAAVAAGFEQLRKKPVPDLPKRLEEMDSRLRELAANLRIEYLNSRPVVKATGSAETLLMELRYGTDWYEPWDMIDETVLAAALSDPAPS